MGASLPEGRRTPTSEGHLIRWGDTHEGGISSRGEKDTYKRGTPYKMGRYTHGGLFQRGEGHLQVWDIHMYSTHLIYGV